MDKVETVGLRRVVPGLLLPANADGAQTALRYLDAHIDTLFSDGFPKLKTIRFMDKKVLGGYPTLKELAPQVQSYLAAFGAQCSTIGIGIVGLSGASV
jgi:hypothetical protein